MKFLPITWIVIIFGAFTTQGQSRVDFLFEKNYNISGVVFPKEYIPHFRLDNISGRFTPSLADIKLAEEYLLENEPNIGYPELTGYYAPARLKDELKHYKRQYIGWLNADKDSVILIQLLNFKQKKRAAYEFEGWEREFIVAEDGFYEANLKKLKVNLSKKIVSLY